MSRITVLLPVYNALPHLKHAVESLINQTLADFSVLVFDDGSTDGSSEYLDSITDPRFTVIHQENTGLAITLNRMLPMVVSEYLARMDADDICLPERLEKQLRFMDEHQDVAAAGTAQGYVAGKKSRASLAFGWPPLTPSYSPPMQNPPYWHPHEDGSTLVHSAVIMRTEALRNVGGYPEIVPGQDVALWYRFAEEGYRLASMQEMLILIRISPSGISSSNLSRQYRTWEYLSYSYKIKQKGEQPASMEIFMNDHPETDETRAARLRTAEFRNSCAVLLEGNILQGLVMLVSFIAKNPEIFIEKVRLRLGGAGS